ncbi:MAG TPA: hypothetical protein VF286_02980, partial [Acidiphilium sp.]
MDGDRTANPMFQKTLQTWDAPMAGSVLVAPGMASFVHIPVPGTMLPNLPKGLVLTVHPPPRYRGSTSSIFIRNPEDTKHGKPGLRLDYGRNEAT